MSKKGETTVKLDASKRLKLDKEKKEKIAENNL